MNTKWLMVASSAWLGALGVAATFAPVELLAAINAPVVAPLPVFMQLLGALYFGFAMANWTAKDNMIGGVYARPLSIANCVHFVAGGLALIKAAFVGNMALPLLVVTVAYAILGALFAYLVFGRGAACVVAPVTGK